MSASRPDAARPPVHAGASRMPAGLAAGLPNHWYPILHADELGIRPVPLRRFGEDLVLWRDADGRPHVFEAHCPHRGAPLSEGRIFGRTLACAYHGWRFDASGTCTAMPLEPADSPRLGRIGVRSWAAEERAGYIWMFHGEAAKATPLQVPLELDDEERLHYRTCYAWDTNWINVLDNVLDPLHAIHLHAGAATQKKRAHFKSFQITADDGTGFRVGKVGLLPDGSTGPVEGEVEFLFPNVVRLDIADGTADGLYRVVIMPTPVDEGRCCAFYSRSRRGRGLKRLRWRLWWAMHERAVHGVASQDRDVLSGIGPIAEARRRENLVSSDVGVVRLRRRLEQEFLAQSQAQ